MGIEMLIKMLLKALGYEREQFDKAIEYVKHEYKRADTRVAEFEERLAGIEKCQREILENQSRVLAALSSENRN